MFHGNMVIVNCGMGHWPKSRSAGMRVSGLCLLLIAAVTTGCGHSQKQAGRGGAFAGSPPPQPPAFLNGPMALLLTSVDGFRAHVVLEGGAAAKGVEVVAGELIGRGGKLVFAPSLSGAAGKHSPASDSAFIWDVNGNHGYMLNEPLQAYALIASNRQFTNVTASAALSAAAPEKVAGHPCQPMEVTVAASDGSATVLRLWRATDLKGLPVRVTCAANGAPLTLTLSKVRLEAMPDDVFLPPKGFKKFDSAEALINELAARQQNLKRHPTYQTEEIEPAGGRDNHQPTRPL